MIGRRPTRIIGLIAILLTTAVLGAAAPAVSANASEAALRPPPFWKLLRGIRQAWKESPEARAAVKIGRKATTTELAQWRSSKGRLCPWRLVKPTWRERLRFRDSRDLVLPTHVEGPRLRRLR